MRIYTFSAMTSDGMQIYIDGDLVPDRWLDQAIYGYTIRPALTEGNHLISVESYERTNIATAHLFWQKN
jgi:hypothetical protein